MESGRCSRRQGWDLRVWSLSSQGTNGAFAALRLAETPDIWLFQETWFDDNAPPAFGRTARSRRYISYTQNNQLNKGGVAVLVRKDIPQRFGHRFNFRGSQGLFIWVRGLFIGSIYSPLHCYLYWFHGKSGSAKIDPSQNWLIGGDFSEIPGDSIAQEFAETIGGTFTSLEGSEIDWFCASSPLAELGSPDLVMSDHRILSTSIGVPIPRPSRGVIPKGPTFVCPNSISDDWQNGLEQEWERVAGILNLSDTLEDEVTSVQEKWDVLQHAMPSTFLAATGQRFMNSRKVQHKGAVAKVGMDSVPQQGPKRPVQERKLRHKLARWFELGRLRSKHFCDCLSRNSFQGTFQLMFQIDGFPTNRFPSSYS